MKRTAFSSCKCTLLVWCSTIPYGAKSNGVQQKINSHAAKINAKAEVIHKASLYDIISHHLVG